MWRWKEVVGGEITGSLEKKGSSWSWDTEDIDRNQPRNEQQQLQDRS